MAQVPPPPQAEGKKTLLFPNVVRIVSPALTFNLFSPFIVKVTSPEGESFAFANNNTITSDNITNKKITTANKINSNINLLYIYTHKTHKTNSHKTSNYKCYT